MGEYLGTDLGNTGSELIDSLLCVNYWQYI